MGNVISRLATALGGEGCAVVEWLKSFLEWLKRLNLPVALGHLPVAFRIESADSYTGGDAPMEVEFFHPHNEISRKAVVFDLKLEINPDKAELFEVSFGLAPRTDVSDAELFPGGCWRGILKVFVRLSSHITIAGTGILVLPDVVAVVGHLVEHSRGHAVQVTVVAGYGSAGGSVERRRGICASMHGQWYSDHAFANDLAFIRLESEFDEEIKPIRYAQTPIAAQEDDLKGQVIAFSGDMTKCGVSPSCFVYNPASPSSLGMLEHKADTEKGASGGAVLNEDGVLIAIHAGYAPDDEDVPLTNTAVTVNRHGNNFEDLIGALLYHTGTGRHANGLPLTRTNCDLPWMPKTSTRLESARWKKSNGCVYDW